MPDALRDAAIDGLDAVRRSKRLASEQTADDVHRGVVDRAKREGSTRSS